MDENPPKKLHLPNFSTAYEAIQTILILFLTLIFALQFYFTFHPEQQSLMTPIMLSAVGMLFMVVGNYMGKVRQNFFVGLKTPWTLADPEVWQKSQRFSGWMFVLGGLIFLLEAWFQFYLLTVFILVIVLVGIVPTVYSYILYRRKKL